LLSNVGIGKRLRLELYNKVEHQIRLHIVVWRTITFRRNYISGEVSGILPMPPVTSASMRSRTASVVYLSH